MVFVFFGTEWETAAFDRIKMREVFSVVGIGAALNGLKIRPILRLSKNGWCSMRWDAFAGKPCVDL